MPKANKVTNLVAFKRPDTLPTVRRSRRKNASLRSQLPHLDSLVQTSTDQFAACWRKRYRIHAIPMSVWSFQTLDKIAGCRVPHTNASVERPGSDKPSIW